jgi:hypothetical protein
MGTAEGLRLLMGRVGEGGRGEAGDRSGDGGEICEEGDDAFLKNVNGFRDLSGG